MRIINRRNRRSRLVPATINPLRTNAQSSGSRYLSGKNNGASHQLRPVRSISHYRPILHTATAPSGAKTGSGRTAKGRSRSAAKCGRSQPSTTNYSIALLIVSTIYRTSSSLTYGPAGRHMPTLKSASLTPFTYAGVFL